MKQISILGCGWLGLPLAKRLLDKGIIVKGSTTSDSKIPTLEKIGVKPFSIITGAEGITGNMDSFLANSEVLFINIPPKMRQGENSGYAKKIQSLLSPITASGISKVIFVSSTSVFDDSQSLVTADTIPDPSSENGKELVKAEEILRSNNSFQTTIVRFGGLIGENRHPVTFLAGRKNVENPDAPINLIHLEDCIGIIEQIIDQDCWGETLNAVTPFHPSRAEYYITKANERNLPAPEFTKVSASAGKVVSSDKIEQLLQYKFKINPL